MLHGGRKCPRKKGKNMATKPITKAEMNMLRDLLEMLKWIGLGEMFGHLGRNQAIIHHEILHDDPNCRLLDKNGNYKKCGLDKRALHSMCELCDNEAAILEYKQKKPFQKLAKFIEEHATRANFDKEYDFKAPARELRLRPNYSMLPKFRAEKVPMQLQGSFKITRKGR